MTTMKNLQKFSVYFIAFLQMQSILKNALYFWIDNLEIYINKKEVNFIDEIVFEIDEDNSPSWYIELSDITFHYSKISPRGYDYWYKLLMIWKTYDQVKGINKDIIIDAFSLNFSREPEPNYGYDENVNPQKQESNKMVLVLYSQLCTLYNQWKFDLISFLEENFSFSQKTRYRRPDFCFDFNLPKPEIMKFLKLRKYKKTKYNHKTEENEILYTYTKKGKKIPQVEFRNYYTAINLKPDWEYETYYTRNILSDKNRLMITRIYDKLSDTFKKKKWFLYTHLDHKFVNRVEVEIRKEYAQTIGYNIYDLLQNVEIQWKVFIEFFNKDLQKDYRLRESDLKDLPFISEVKEYKQEAFTRIETREYDLSENFQKLWFIPKRYMDHANGYAKNILDQTGYHWFTQYILWNYFDDDRKVIRDKDGKPLYTCYRKPDILLWFFLEYIKETLHFPQARINTILRRYITIPTLKLKK